MSQLQDLIDKHKITVHTAYVPYAPEALHSDKKDHRGDPLIRNDIMDLSMKWSVSVQIGRNEFTTTYSMGSGHCMYPKTLDNMELPDHFPFYGRSHERQLMFWWYAARLLDNPRHPLIHQHHRQVMSYQFKRVKQPDPEPVEIIYSLLMDADAAMGKTPGEFMGDFGYTDFDEGFKAYQECQEVERFWMSAVGPAVFGQLLEAMYVWEEEDARDRDQST